MTGFEEIRGIVELARELGRAADVWGLKEQAWVLATMRLSGKPAPGRCADALRMWWSAVEEAIKELSAAMKE